MKMDIRKKLEQIRRGKKSGNKPSSGGINKNKSNVKDLRQIIAKKTKKKAPPTSRDLRDTNKKLVRRKTTTTTSTNSRNESRPMSTRSTKTTVNPQQIKQRHVAQSQEYYVPPPMRRNQSTFILAPPMMPNKPVGMNTATEHHGNASVLISNLNPAITQSDIIELYGGIGALAAVNMINQTTALVTYHNSGDAFRAVKVYHNRLLDGRPMLVNMMPTSV